MQDNQSKYNLAKEDEHDEEAILKKLPYQELRTVTGGSSPGLNPPWDGWFKDRPPIVW